MKQAIALSILAFTSVLQAAPADVYDSRSIRNSTNSQTLRDDKDRDTLYVTQPMAGHLVKWSLQANVTSEECEALEMMERAEIEAREKVRILKTQYLDAVLDNNFEATTDVLEKQNRYNSAFKIFKDIKSAIVSFHQEYSKPGGTIHLQYATEWDKNIEALKKENPFFKRVVRLEGTNPRITSGLDAMKDFMKDFYLGIKIKTNKDNVVADVGITKLAACFYKYPAPFDIDPKPPVFSLTVTLDYPHFGYLTTVYSE